LGLCTVDAIADDAERAEYEGTKSVNGKLTKQTEAAAKRG